MKIVGKFKYIEYMDVLLYVKSLLCVIIFFFLYNYVGYMNELYLIVIIYCICKRNLRRIWNIEKLNMIIYIIRLKGLKNYKYKIYCFLIKWVNLVSIIIFCVMCFKFIGYV